MGKATATELGLHKLLLGDAVYDGSPPRLQLVTHKSPSKGSEL